MKKIIAFGMILSMICNSGTLREMCIRDRAMAHRIPAIATEVGGTPEIVIDGTNGVLLSSDFSNEQLVNAIKKIYFLDVKHKEKINENAYETSRKYFDAEKNYNDFYDEILNLN